MDNLDEVAGFQPVDLDALFEQEKRKRNIPELVAKNQAAMTALLTPAPVDTYENLMMELSQGETYTLDQIKKEDALRNREKNLQTVLEILGDPTLPDDIKQGAVMAINAPKDTSMRVREEALMDDDDTIDGKPDNEIELRKGVMAETLGAIYAYDAEVQALMNQNKVFENELTLGKVAGFMAFLAPFATSASTNRTFFDIAESLKIDPSRAEATFLSGNFKRQVIDTLKAIPPENRMEAVERIIDIVESTNGVYFGSDNDFNTWLLGQEVIQGNYSKLDQFLDNATSLLDTTVFGGMLARAIKGFRASAKAEKAAKEAISATEAIKTTPVPTAPANVVGSVNNSKGRDFLKVVIESDSDELATVMYGKNRQDSVQAAVMPDPARADGTMASKVADPVRSVRIIKPDPDVARAVRDDGTIHLTAAEKTAASTKVINNFEKITNVFPLDNSSQIGVLDGGVVQIRALYAGPDGGFLKAEDALAQAEFTFRDYGVTEANTTLMQKVENEWRPVELEDVKGVDGEFAVRIDVDRPLTAQDIDFEEFDVALNMLGQVPYSFSFPQSLGSFSRMLVTPDAMFRPEISRSAARGFDRAVDIEKALLRKFDGFGKDLKKLDKTQREMLKKHILEANHYGLELSDADMLSRGFNQEAIAAMKKWRDAWDTHFYYENRDLVTTLRAGGYQKFVSKNGDDFTAKPIKQPSYKPTKVYDSTEGVVKTLSGEEVKALYEQGGYLATFRRPIKFEDDVAEVVVVRNTPEEYTRMLSDSDQVLNYRKGYFSRRYDAPKFVEQRVLDKNGDLAYTKVVAVSDNLIDAERFLKRKAAEEGVDPEEWGKVRDDIKTFDATSDAYWDLTAASGRLAHRQRGQLLEDAAGPVDISSTQYVLDPSEAAIRASRSLAGRLSLRDMIETTKARTLEQYSEYFPKNAFGQPMWTDPDKLLVQTTATERRLADARSTVEYVNYLERGYQNTMDKAYKSIVHWTADAFGRMGVQSLDKNIRVLAGSNPFGFTKNLTFTGYLATHPLRQWIIQPSQTLRLSAYNPQYVMSGKVVDDGLKLTFYKTLEGSLGKEKAREIFKKKFGQKDYEMIEFIDDSGLLSSVDRSNMVRGPLTSLADSSNRAAKIAAAPLNVVRRVGYDFGEQINIATHALAVRDKYIRAGKDVKDKAVRDEVLGVTRSISWDMNKAGDFPYNQNWMSPVTQFLQIPHKALMMYFSRSIPTGDKLRFAAADLMLYGPPMGNRITSLVPEENLPEDPFLRDMIWNGGLSATINFALSQLAGDDRKYNFESLRPFEMDGWGAMITATIEGGPLAVIQEGPFFNLLAKETSPVMETFAMAMRYIQGTVNPEENWTKEGIIDIFKEGSKFFKGIDNYYKAQMIIETGKLVDRHGNVVGEDADTMDAIMQYLGFSRQELSAYYEASKSMREDSKSYEKDVEDFYKEVLRFTAREGVYSDNPERAELVLGIMTKVYSKEPRAMKLISGWLARDMQANDAKILRQAIEYAQIKTDAVTEEKLRKYLATRPAEEQEKTWKLFRDLRDNFKQYREEEKQ